VAALVGSVVELASQLGVQVPMLDAVCRLTRQLDRSLRRS
jgi:ketopantoate reductase